MKYRCPKCGGMHLRDRNLLEQATEMGSVFQDPIQLTDVLINRFKYRWGKATGNFDDWGEDVWQGGIGKYKGDGGLKKCDSCLAYAVKCIRCEHIFSLSSKPSLDPIITCPACNFRNYLRSS